MSSHLKSYYISIFFLCTTFLLIADSKLFAQTDSFYYKIIIESKDENISGLKNFRDSFPSALLNTKLKLLFNTLYDKGYLLSEINDSISCTGKTCSVFINSGPQCVIAEIRNVDISKDMLQSLGYNELIIKQKKYSNKEISKLRNRILTVCENNGYPFANVYFDSIEADSGGTLSAMVFLDYGPQILLDSLEIIPKTINGV